MKKSLAILLTLALAMGFLAAMAIPASAAYSIAVTTPSIANGGAHTFTGAFAGYAPIGAVSFTISNTGADAMTDLDVGMSGGSASSFDLVISSLDRTLASGGTTSFTIKPSDGLAAGVYTEIVTISDANIPNYQFIVTFTVTATQAPNITGPQNLTLGQGYAATYSGEFTVTGVPEPTVTVTVKTGDTDNGGRISWNNETKRLDIAPGLTQGDYRVYLKAVNIASESGEHSFTVTIDAPGGGNDSTPWWAWLLLGLGGGGILAPIPFTTILGLISLIIGIIFMLV